MAESNIKKTDRFDSIDGLRAISCIAIIAMHVRSNTDYNISGFFYDTIVASWTWLVYLFIMISGFSMCAGYLERFHNGTVSLESFFLRRYSKILPFFGLLVVIAVIFEHNMSAFYEGSVELTLLYGLLPNNNVSVLGVCWTLGVIFVFYLLFPFFSILMKNNKRAVFSLAVSLWIVYACINHFFSDSFVTASFTPRHSFIFCMPLFVSGGLIYINRDRIIRFCSRFSWLLLACCIALTVLWYVIKGNDFVFYIKSLVLFSLWLAYAIGKNDFVLASKPMKFFSSISMEMYLAQMIVFRVIEKTGLHKLTGNDVINFIIAMVLEIVLLVVAVEIYRVAFSYVNKFFKEKKVKK